MIVPFVARRKMYSSAESFNGWRRETRDTAIFHGMDFGTANFVKSSYFRICHKTHSAWKLGISERLINTISEEISPKYWKGSRAKTDNSILEKNS
jgi:hypothetical protein